MPRFDWGDEEKRNSEWRVANELLRNVSDGTKIKRSRRKKPIDYTDPRDQSTVNLNHSFIKINGKILAMAGEGRYLGRGAYGKVKLAEDQEGKLYALKIGHELGDVSEEEIGIANDVGIYDGKTTRIDNPEKEVVSLPYLGVSLDRIRVSTEESELLAFRAINEVNRLHHGQLSRESKKYLHADIKAPNLVVDSNGKVKLIDYGLSIPAGDDVFGYKKAHTRLNVTDKHYYFAPETRYGKGRFSYKSDTYSLGWACRSVLSSRSNLRPIVRKMCDDNPMERPSLNLVEVAFLAEIHKGNDLDLERALAACRT
jgi:hypothetical protein